MNPIQQIAQEINAKLDAIMQKLGIESSGQQPSEQEYMKASNDQKDAMDKQQILGRQ